MPAKKLHLNLFKFKLYKSISVIAFFIIIILLIFFSFNNADNKKIVFKPAEEVKNNEPSAIKNPSILGYDSNNMPYSIHAKEAVEVEKEIIKLKFINAEGFASNKKWLAAIANEGIVYQKKNILTLLNGVQIYSDQEEEMKIDNIDINIKEGTANSKAKVEIAAPTLNLTANNGVEVTKFGKLIKFHGPIKARIKHK